MRQQCVLFVKNKGAIGFHKKCSQLFHNLITSYTKLNHPINYAYIPLDNDSIPFHTGLSLISHKPPFQWNTVSYHYGVKDDMSVVTSKMRHGIYNVYECGLCSMNAAKFTKITDSIGSKYNYYSHIIEYKDLYVTTHEVDLFVEPHFFIVTKNHIENFGYFYMPYILDQVYDILGMFGESFYAIGQGYMGSVPQHCHFHISNEPSPIFKYIPHVKLKHVKSVQYGIHENKIVLIGRCVNLLYGIINNLHKHIGQYLHNSSLDCSIACGYYNNEMCIILSFIVSKTKSLLQKKFRFSVPYGKFFCDNFGFTEQYLRKEQLLTLLQHFDTLSIELCQLEPYLSEIFSKIRI